MYQLLMGHNYCQNIHHSSNDEENYVAKYNLSQAL